MAEFSAEASALDPVLGSWTLEDRYDLGKNRVLMTGTQAIVRLLLMQKELDRRAGLNTAGFVTGYRGSPLGGVDAQMLRAKRHLDAAGDHLHAGAQRGPRRDRDLGRAAGRDARRRPV